METVQNTPEKKLKGKHMTSAKPGSINELQPYS